MSDSILRSRIHSRHLVFMIKSAAQTEPRPNNDVVRQDRKKEDEVQDLEVLSGLWHRM